MEGFEPPLDRDGQVLLEDVAAVVMAIRVEVLRAGGANRGGLLQHLDVLKAETDTQPPTQSRSQVVRTHQSRIDAMKKNPAISHQPPSLRGQDFQAVFLDWGAKDGQKSSRKKKTGFQSTEAAMLRPMITNLIEKEVIDKTRQAAGT